MVKKTSPQITLLLMDWSKGNKAALDELMPLVYQELRQMAQRYMRKQSAGHTFQTTELIHEAHLKLAAGEERNWQNRAHFFGVAAKAMQHILVDYARSKQTQKRGNLAEKVTLKDHSVVSTTKPQEIVALDDAPEQLARLDERKAQVVEMKFFGGLVTDEIASVLKISLETVKRDWRFSRTWLLREMSKVA